jgi:molecular chaperone GrpE
VRHRDDEPPDLETHGPSPSDNGRRPGTDRLEYGHGPQGSASQATHGDRERARLVASSEEAGDAVPAPAPGDQVDWQDCALRLQAEMENYRRRQKRLAQEEIESERERLLRAFLEVVDDLERALANSSPEGSGLREGVQLTHRAALQWLKKENVERIEAQGRRFDPAWHEAISTAPGRPLGVAPETVVQVLEPGYRLGDRLLRPARVVVAV